MQIRLCNIRKSFDQKEIIKGISLVIDSGKLTTLLGPSGCGKTTLLRMIAGLEVPDKGEIYLGDQCVFSSEKKIFIKPEKRNLGYVFQDFALWPHLTVFENVAFGLRALKKKDNLKEKVMKALRAVELEDFAYRYPGSLSGGQQQRVAFARAIVIEPECILFDEALSALDSSLRKTMRTELTTLISSLGITAIFVTHDQTEAMSMSHKIAVLNAGVVEQYDTPENIYSKPATRFVAKFVGLSNWISKNAMFRPEKASLQRLDNSVDFDCKVTSLEFLGNTYEAHFKHGENNWCIPTEKNLPVGQDLKIFVKNENIIRL